MNVIYKKLDEIFPYENNPRINDDAVEYVRKSIGKFGFRVPIIIDKNNVIVAGHTRFKAAEELKLEEVPCLIADDLTDEQIREYRLVDNKVSEYSRWDAEKLDLELEDLELSDFGFITHENDDFNVDDFFIDSEEVKEKEPKKVQCPHCGEWFEV